MTDRKITLCRACGEFKDPDPPIRHPKTGQMVHLSGHGRELWNSGKRDDIDPDDYLVCGDDPGWSRR